MALLTRVIVGLEADDRKLRAGLSRAGRATDDFNRKLSRTAGQIGRVFRAAAIGATAGLTLAARQFAQIEKALLTTASSTGRTLAQIETQYLDTISRIRVRTGVEGAAIADGLTKALSSGFEGDAARELVDQASRAVAAGVSESVAELVSSTTTVLTAFRSEGNSVAETMDRIIRTAQIGEGEVTEFGNVFKSVSGQLANAGLGLDSVAAALATISRVAPSVSEAGTQLRAFVQQLQRVKTRDALAETFGISVADIEGFLRADDLQGLIGLFDDLFIDIFTVPVDQVRAQLEKTAPAARQAVLESLLREGRSLETFGEAFRSTEAVQGLISLVTQTDVLAENLVTLSGATGTIDKAFENFDGTLTQIAGSSLQLFQVAIESAFRDSFREIPTQQLEEFQQVIRNLGIAAGNLVQFLVELTVTVYRHRDAIVLAVKAWLLWKAAAFVGGVLATLGALGTLIVTLAKNFRALAASLIATTLPFVAFLTAGAAIGLLVSNWEQALDFLKATVRSFVAAFELLFGRVVLIGTQAAQAVFEAFDNALTAVANLGNAVIEALNKVRALIGGDRIEFMFTVDRSTAQALEASAVEQAASVAGLIAMRDMAYVEQQQALVDLGDAFVSDLGTIFDKGRQLLSGEIINLDAQSIATPSFNVPPTAPQLAAEASGRVAASLTDESNKIFDGVGMTLQTRLGEQPDERHLQPATWSGIGMALVTTAAAECWWRAYVGNLFGSLFSAIGGAAGGGLFSAEHGGVVPGPPGQPRLILAHGGEEYLGVNGERGDGRGGVTIMQQFNGGLTAQQRQEVASMGRELAGSVRAEFRRAANSRVCLMPTFLGQQIITPVVFEHVRRRFVGDTISLDRNIIETRAHRWLIGVNLEPDVGGVNMLGPVMEAHKMEMGISTAFDFPVVQHPGIVLPNSTYEVHQAVSAGATTLLYSCASGHPDRRAVSSGTGTQVYVATKAAVTAGGTQNIAVCKPTLMAAAAADDLIDFHGDMRVAYSPTGTDRYTYESGSVIRIGIDLEDV